MRPAAAISRARVAGAGFALAVRLMAIVALMIGQVLAGPLNAEVAGNAQISNCMTQHTGHQDGMGAPSEECLRCADCLAAQTAPPRLAIPHSATALARHGDREAGQTRTHAVLISGPAQFWSSQRAPPWPCADRYTRAVWPPAAAPAAIAYAHTRRVRSWV